MKKLLDYLFPSRMVLKKKISIEAQLEHLGGYWKRQGGFLVSAAMAGEIVAMIKKRNLSRGTI